jgi:hypothetical protein
MDSLIIICKPTQIAPSMSSLESASRTTPFYLTGRKSNLVKCETIKFLFCRLADSLRGPYKLQGLTLLGCIVRKQPVWLYRIAQHSLLKELLKLLKVLQSLHLNLFQKVLTFYYTLSIKLAAKNPKHFCTQINFIMMSKFRLSRFLLDCVISVSSNLSDSDFLSG